MKLLFKYLVCALVLAFALGYFLLSRKSPADNSTKMQWIQTSVIGGPLNGVWEFSVKDYGKGLAIRSWELPNNPDWIDGFRAANGMSHLDYLEFKRHVSKKLLTSMNLDEESNFNKMRSPAAETVDYEVYKVVYLKGNNLEYAFVSSWDNQRGKREDLQKRVEADGKTKFLGSWLPLRKQGDMFVLISLNELEEHGINLFPYGNNDELHKWMINKKFNWDDSQKKYVSP